MTREEEIPAWAFLSRDEWDDVRVLNFWSGQATEMLVPRVDGRITYASLLSGALNESLWLQLVADVDAATAQAIYDLEPGEPVWPLLIGKHVVIHYGAVVEDDPDGTAPHRLLGSTMMTVPSGDLPECMHAVVEAVAEDVNRRLDADSAAGVAEGVSLEMLRELAARNGGPSGPVPIIPVAQSA